MANIISKAFDRTQKIIRTIFKGSPNLFTTDDLNRQFEAIQYHLMELSQRTPARIDMEITATAVNDTTKKETTYKITPKLTGDKLLYTYGCTFDMSAYDGKEISVATSLNSDLFLVYYIFKHDSKTITFTDDATHKISGTTFTDGSSKASADNLVYGEGHLVLLSTSEFKSYLDEGALFVVLAKFSIDKAATNTTVVTTPYFRNSTQVPFGVSDGVASSGETDTLGKYYTGDIFWGQDLYEGVTGDSAGIWRLGVTGNIAHLHVELTKAFKNGIEFDLGLLNFPKIYTVGYRHAIATIMDDVMALYKVTEDATTISRKKLPLTRGSDAYFSTAYTEQDINYLPKIYMGGIEFDRTGIPNIQSIQGALYMEFTFICTQD